MPRKEIICGGALKELLARCMLMFSTPRPVKRTQRRAARRAREQVARRVIRVAASLLPRTRQTNKTMRMLRAYATKRHRAAQRHDGSYVSMARRRT